MSDPKTLAFALIRRLEMPVVGPSASSPDGLPENTPALERADDELLEALALCSGRVTVAELIKAMHDPTVLHAAGHYDDDGGVS